MGISFSGFLNFKSKYIPSSVRIRSLIITTKIKEAEIDYGCPQRLRGKEGRREGVTDDAVLGQRYSRDDHRCFMVLSIPSAFLLVLNGEDGSEGNDFGLSGNDSSEETLSV